MKKLLFSCCCCVMLCMSGSLCAQGDPKEVKEEKVETVWAFAKYLGGRLGSELKDRLNMTDGEEAKETVKVKIRVWKFEVERVEERVKADS